MNRPVGGREADGGHIRARVGCFAICDLSKGFDLCHPRLAYFGHYPGRKGGSVKVSHACRLAHLGHHPFPPRQVMHFPPRQVMHFPPRQVMHFPPRQVMHFPPRQVVHFPPRQVVHSPRQARDAFPRQARDAFPARHAMHFHGGGLF